MKTLLITFISAILGMGLGYWRVATELANNPHVVGEDIDLDALNLASTEFEKSQEVVSPTEAVPTYLSMAKVEVIGETSLDFGTMKQATVREHSFQIKNAGLGPLELKVLGSSCKCTIGSLEKSVLAPGEQTGVKLQWRSEGVLGSFSQTATIGTNDPRQQEVQFSVHGKIGQNYILEPAELSFGEFSAKDTFTRNFKLYSYEAEPLQVVGRWADFDESRVKLTNTITSLTQGEVPEHADARYVADYTVSVTPGLPAGPINGQIRLGVGPEHFPMSLRCTGKCISDLRIVAGPDYNEKSNIFNVGRFTSVEGGEKMLWIAARNEGEKLVELKLKKFLPESLDGAFAIVIGEPKRNPTQTLFPIKFQIPKGSQAINRGGTSPDNYIKLFFETNLEPAGEISLYLKLLVVAEE